MRRFLDMLEYFANILRDYPPLALFLTLGIGYFIGRLRIGSFSLGNVTAVLLTGVVIGQLNIPMPGPLKNVFFMMFLFSIGYSVGPDFFKSFRGQGGKQALFAVVMSSLCFVTTLGSAWMFGYSKGETVGLFSGAQTCSALLGVGSEALSRLGLPDDALKDQLDIIPVCYAVTYIFGTLGTVVILGNFGPKLLGGLEKVKARTAELEKQLHSPESSSSDPALINAHRSAAYRSYVVDGDFFAKPRTVKETERYLRSTGRGVSIDRLKHNGSISAPRYDDLIYAGDSIVVCGRSEHVIGIEPSIGHETADAELLNYPLERVGIVVARKSFTGKTILEIRKNSWIHGVVIRDATRDGKPIDIDANTTFMKRDRLTILGRAEHVKNAAAHIGHIDRPSVATDIMFVGLAIFIGGLFGAMSFWIGNIPVSFGTSGGSLIAGIIFGWLRSRRPTFGNISPGALWIMNNLGLSVFIAVIGIESAPSFISGIKTVGPMLFAAGAIATTIPLLLGIFIGNRLFKFNPAITLGCCAGTRTCTASLGAVQDAIGSTLPAIGYTVTYAVSNLLLVIWGLLTVILI